MVKTESLSESWGYVYIMVAVMFVVAAVRSTILAIITDSSHVIEVSFGNSLFDRGLFILVFVFTTVSVLISPLQAAGRSGDKLEDFARYIRQALLMLTAAACWGYFIFSDIGGIKPLIFDSQLVYGVVAGFASLTSLVLLDKAIRLLKTDF